MVAEDRVEPRDLFERQLLRACGDVGVGRLDDQAQGCPEDVLVVEAVVSLGAAERGERQGRRDPEGEDAHAKG